MSLLSVVVQRLSVTPTCCSFWKLSAHLVQYMQNKDTCSSYTLKTCKWRQLRVAGSENKVVKLI